MYMHCFLSFLNASTWIFKLTNITEKCKTLPYNLVDCSLPVEPYLDGCPVKVVQFYKLLIFRLVGYCPVVLLLNKELGKLKYCTIENHLHL